MKQDKKKNNIIKIILGIIIILGILYIVIDKSFASLAVDCKKADVPEAACECLKTKISKNVPFMDKAIFLVSGATAEQLASYISIMDALDCAVRDPSFRNAF
ncbi:MAG: hypothetical protein II843_00190 [Alphaproteobacteria bacterium]|nr:hypothetical protein [Alphaproteobacteria bacterium]MBQ6011819.1 hypothetical protein [Alphaproteobacteria bacterium]MCQ2568593.1 hypothetical protein [Alphaproteobacteria bacterium]